MSERGKIEWLKHREREEKAGIEKEDNHRSLHDNQHIFQHTIQHKISKE